MKKKNLIRYASVLMAGVACFTLAGCFGGEKKDNTTDQQVHGEPTQASVDTEGFTEKELAPISKEDAANGIWIEYTEGSSFVASDADDNQFVFTDNKVSVDENIDVKSLKDGDTTYFYLATGSFSMLRGNVSDITIWSYVNGKPMSRTRIDSIVGNKIALFDNRGGMVLDGENTELNVTVYPYMYAQDENVDNSSKGVNIKASTGGSANIYLANSSLYGDISCWTSDADVKNFTSLEVSGLGAETFKSEGHSCLFDYSTNTISEGIDMTGTEGTDNIDVEPAPEDETQSEEVPSEDVDTEASETSEDS